MKNIPFSIFALAPFQGVSVNGTSPQIIGPLSAEGLDDEIAALGCRVDIALPKSISRAGEISLDVRCLGDLEQEYLIQRSPYLAGILEALAFAKEHRDEPAAVATAIKDKFRHLPIQVPRPTESATNPKESENSILDSLLSKVDIPDAPGESADPPDVQLETLLDRTLTEINNNDEFQQLEGTLRGASLLLREAGIREETGVEVYLVPVDILHLEEVLRHIVRGSSNRAPSLVLLDLQFDNTYSNVDALETVANFSEAIAAPTVVSMSSRFFGVDTWEGLEQLGYLSHVLDGQAYAKYRALQKKAAGNWVAAALPEIVVSRHTASCERSYRMSPIWSVGALAAHSHTKFGWSSRLMEVDHCRVCGETEAKNRIRIHMSPLSNDRIRQLEDIDTALLRTTGSDDYAVCLPSAPTITGGELSTQLFTARLLAFFQDQKEKLSGQPFSGPEALASTLEDVFLTAWNDSGAPSPKAFSISATIDNATRQMILSVSVTPPAAVVPNTAPISLDLVF